MVVTARRRDENLQDTPIAISAFSAQVLQDRQILQTQDLERITPSLQFKPAGQLSGNSASAVVFIRGVGQVDPTAAVDPGVGIYLDEVYLGRAVGGAIDFGDIAGVEVLRGPQGTLFGRNTIGGAILVRTREPELGTFSGRGRARIGDDALREGFLSVNLPIASTLAARVGGGFRYRDGYVIRAFDGKDLGNESGYSLNGALKWEPSAAFKSFLRADYSRRKENGAPFVFAGINEQAPVAAIASVAAGCPGATIPFAPITPGNPRFGAPNVPLINDVRCANDFQARGDFVNGGNAPVMSMSKVWGVANTATLRLSDELIAKSITAFRKTESRGIRDADNTPLTLITTDVGSSSKQFSQELQLQADYGKVSGIVGGYYFREVTKERATVFLAFPPSPPVISSLLAGGPGSRDLQVSTLKTGSVAAFGELTWAPVDRLEVTGGLRYTRDKKYYQGTVLNLFPATQPDPNPLPTLATTQGGPLFIFNTPNRRTFSAVTGSASVQYRWSNALSTYLSYARSFKSGGFNTRYNAATANNLPVPFADEKVTSYEAGVKTNIGRLRFNVAAFNANYDDIQLIFRQGVVPLLFNAGKARIRGLEAEANYRTSFGPDLRRRAQPARRQDQEHHADPRRDRDGHPERRPALHPEDAGQLRNRLQDRARQRRVDHPALRRQLHLETDLHHRQHPADRGEWLFRRQRLGGGEADQRVRDLGRRQQHLRRALPDPGQCLAGDARLCRAHLRPPAQLVRADLDLLLRSYPVKREAVRHPGGRLFLCAAKSRFSGEGASCGPHRFCYLSARLPFEQEPK